MPLSLIHLAILAAAAALVFLAVLILRARRREPRYNEPGRIRVGDEQPDRAGRDPGLLLVVALSGGGTRAAAFAWQTLLELGKIRYEYVREGVTRQTTLGDEIALISGISGGSFAAAGWSLFRHRPETFEQRFLRRDIESELLRSLLWPPRHWQLLLSSRLERIHLAAELYDREVFDGKLLGQLPPWPQLRIHATNLTVGARFSFTPGDFAFLGSDASTYPVGYACAASSAFPGLLSPLTLRNYGDTIPLEELFENDRHYRHAKKNSRKELEADLQRRLREFYNDKDNRFVHLADGGLVDNQGLQAVLDEVDDGGLIYRALFNMQSPLQRLVVVSVNAGVASDDESSRFAEPPGIASVLKYTMMTSMDVLSAKRWTQIKSRIKNLTSYDHPLFEKLEKPYMIEVSFRKILDDKTRRECNRLPTSFHLERSELDLIAGIVPQLLAEDEEMQRLQASLAGEAAPG